LHIESPVGVHENLVGPLDVGAGREHLLCLHAPAGDPDPFDGALLRVIADPANELGELDERNNVAELILDCADRATIKPVVCGEQPLSGTLDLVVDGERLHAACTLDAATGRCRVEVAIPVRNDGASWTPAGTGFRIASALGSWDTSLGAIAPGTSHIVSVTYDLSVPLPDAVAGGDLLFAIIVDAEDALPELDEENNEALLVLPCNECAGP
jgi:hypothetical protein